MYQICSCYRRRGPKIFGMLPYTRPPPILLLIVVLLAKPKLCTKFEVASFNGCRNKYGVPKFLGCSPSPDPANFGPNSCFLISYSPNPSCVPNLELLASTVAEISKGYQNFWDAPLAPTPPVLFLGTLLAKPNLCTKFEVASFTGCRDK